MTHSRDAERVSLAAWWANEADECRKLELHDLARQCRQNAATIAAEDGRTIAEMLEGIKVTTWTP